MYKALSKVADGLAIALAFLAFYVGGWGVFDNVWVSGLTVWLGFMIGFLSFKETATTVEFVKNPLVLCHLALAAIFTWVLWKWAGIMLEQEEFFIEISRFDDILAWVGVAITGYMTWRFFGTPMLAVFLVMTYFVAGPEQYFAAGEDWMRIAENLWYSTDGAYGRPVEIIGRVVLIFILFGAVLQTSGAGEILLKFAFAGTGRFAGGPAHAAIVGSAMFGTLSGAAVANVVSTGVFTIPIIKKSGFSPRFAGAVEAAASTGGQIMPPVMGVVAFLMADVTGIPYLKIVVAALIPAAMYYLSLFMVVLIEARKRGIGAVPVEERQRLTGSDWLKSLAFWVPLGVLVSYLLDGRTPQNAGFAATIAAFIMCLLFFPSYRNPKKWLETAVSAGRTSATLMIIATSIGFVIGVVNMTGIGLMFAELILSVAGSDLFVSLILVMFGCLVMGMGVPTGAAYLIIAIVLGPALEKLGLPTISAHLFVVYFGVLSVVTPPVALAAFAAAPIAGSKPMETGLEASRLAIAGFIIPFIFVYHPDILIIVDGYSFIGMIWACAAFIVATWSIATGLSGFDLKRLIVLERILRIFVGLAVLLPDYRMAGPATLFVVALIGYHRITTTRIINRETI